MDYVYSVKLNNQSAADYAKVIPKRFKLANRKHSSIESNNKKSLL